MGLYTLTHDLANWWINAPSWSRGTFMLEIMNFATPLFGPISKYVLLMIHSVWLKINAIRVKGAAHSYRSVAISEKRSDIYHKISELRLNSDEQIGPIDCIRFCLAYILSYTVIFGRICTDATIQHIRARCATELPISNPTSWS